MTSLTPVFDRLRPVLSDVLGLPPDDIRVDSALVDDLGCDSLDRIEAVMLAEDEFGVDITDDDLETVVTVNDLVTIIEQKQAS